MKQSILILASLLFSVLLYSQTKYYDAAQFPLIGKISDKTETRYERLPAVLKDVTRPPVWNLGKNTSGLAIRFRSNSTSISAKWEVLNNNHMDHMADVGVKGLDLYSWDGETWKFVNSGRPTEKINDKVIIQNMNPTEKEFMLYLPLYDGLVSLSIGIDSLASIGQPASEYPLSSKPIVVYGTSITQGGCATRPGMSYTNILSRMLNREIINLGFSGNGKLDYEIAETMAERQDLSLFILDFIPNVNAEQIKEKTANFVAVLRKKNPNTPILFVETAIFPHSYFDKYTLATITEKNRLLRAEYEALKNAGDDNLFYLNGEHLIGSDNEGTVDGVHFTDLGFLRMAENIRDCLSLISY